MRLLKEFGVSAAFLLACAAFTISVNNLTGCQTITGAINSAIVKIGLPDPGNNQLQGIAVQSVPNTLSVLGTYGLLRAEVIDKETARQAVEVTDDVHDLLVRRAESALHTEGAFRGPVAVAADIVRYMTIISDVATEAETIVANVAAAITTAQEENRDLTEEEINSVFAEYDKQKKRVMAMIN